MKIYFFEGESWENEVFREKLSDSETSFFAEALTQEHLPEERDAEALSVFVKSKITADVLAAFPNLKFIATRSTGFDHIDLAACKARGVTVSSVPSYGENTVAEFAFALILALARKIVPAANRTREGKFSYEGLMGFDMMGKTLGVIGTGHIGYFVIQIAKGFGMNVRAFDPRENAELAQKLGFTYGTLHEVLADSDIVTLHVPYRKETHHLINEEAFQKMKKGAILINTSRGAVVETEALLAALSSGQLGGAGLDVLEEETALKEGDGSELNAEQKRTFEQSRRLMQMENVIVSPHTAFNTREAIRRILDTTIENVQAFAKEAPINTVPTSPHS